MVRMFSFAGDTVLNPFAGTCSTAIAAYKAGRNSISNEIDPRYAEIGVRKLREAVKQRTMAGAVEVHISEFSDSRHEEIRRDLGELQASG